LVQVFSELATPLPTYTLDRPILHTDLLLATVARHYKVAVLLAPDAPAELRAAVQRLQPRIIHRRVAAADQVPPASAKVVLPDGTSIVVDSPSTLATAILPAPSP
jgi:hypothetical protein